MATTATKSHSTKPEAPRTSGPEPILMTMKQVTAYLQLSRDTIDRLRSKGKFPRPVGLGIGDLRFRTADVKRWVERMATKT